MLLLLLLSETSHMSLSHEQAHLLLVGLWHDWRGPSADPRICMIVDQTVSVGGHFWFWSQCLRAGGACLHISTVAEWIGRWIDDVAIGRHRGSVHFWDEPPELGHEMSSLCIMQYLWIHTVAPECWSRLKMHEKLDKLTVYGRDNSHLLWLHVDIGSWSINTHRWRMSVQLNRAPGRRLGQRRCHRTRHFSHLWRHGPGTLRHRSSFCCDCMSTIGHVWKPFLNDTRLFLKHV